MVVGHAGHVMGGRLAAQRGHGRVVEGDEITNDDAHGAVVQEFAGGVVVGGGDFEDIACGEFVAATIEEKDGRNAEEFAVVVHFGVERGDGFFARDVFERELFGEVVHVTANAEKGSAVFHDDCSVLFAIAGGQIVARIGAGFYVHPGGVDAFQFGAISGLLVGNRDFEVDVFVRSVRWIVDHSFDADFVAHLDTITVAGDFGPIGEFAASAENVFFLIGAEKIGAVLVPESRVMKDAAGNGVAVGIDKLWGIGEEPAVDGDLPFEVGRLGHFHVAGVRGEVHWADADNDGVTVDFLFELDAFSHGMVHAALHEAAVLHVVHVVGSIGRFVLSEQRAGDEQGGEKENYFSHGLTLVRRA